MITKNGVKMTANKYAKETILDRLDDLLEGYWVEGNWDVENLDLDSQSKTFGKNIAPITEREVKEIQKMINKRIKGITKYLGYSSGNKYY
tara:strand:+ start:246 stop:515 length:270 start_codon:yes stop_codon:yes gene_type:complete